MLKVRLTIQIVMIYEYGGKKHDYNTYDLWCMVYYKYVTRENLN